MPAVNTLIASVDTDASKCVERSTLRLTRSRGPSSSSTKASSSTDALAKDLESVLRLSRTQNKGTTRKVVVKVSDRKAQSADTASKTTSTSLPRDVDRPTAKPVRSAGGSRTSSSRSTLSSRPATVPGVVSSDKNRSACAVPEQSEALEQTEPLPWAKAGKTVPTESNAQVKSRVSVSNSQSKIATIGTSKVNPISNDKLASFKECCQGFAQFLDRQNTAKLANLASKQPISAVFLENPQVALEVKKLARTFLNDTSISTIEMVPIFAAEMETGNIPPAARGAITEYLLDMLEPFKRLPRFQAAILGFGDLLLDNYNVATYPIRRLRVVVRQLALLTATGVTPDRSSALITELNNLFTQRDVGQDVALFPYKVEYRARALLIWALYTYHSVPESSTRVAKLGQAALDAVRRLVLPPVRQMADPQTTDDRRNPMSQAPPVVAKGRSGSGIKSRTTRIVSNAQGPKIEKSVNNSLAEPDTRTDVTPPRVAFDNREQLCQLLNALAALFGVLGHVLSKTETLKHLRAVQRGSGDMVDGFIQTSARLATEYAKLGKYSRATLVFAQAVKYDTKHSASLASRIELHLRYSHFLSVAGQVKLGRNEYLVAEGLAQELPPPNTKAPQAYWIEQCGACERRALAHHALAAIKMAENDATAAIRSLQNCFLQWCHAANCIARLAAPADVPDKRTELGIGKKPETTTNPETSKSSDTSTKEKSRPPHLANKHLSGMQWYCAEAMFEAAFNLYVTVGHRGSVKESRYYLAQVEAMVPFLKSSMLATRVSSRTARLEARLRQIDLSAKCLQKAEATLKVVDGPDALEIKCIRGDLLSRQQETDAANDAFATVARDIADLDTLFAAVEARLPSPQKDSIVRTAMSARVVEPLYPLALGHVLRRRAWLLHEAGETDEYDTVLEQLRALSRPPKTEVQQLFLDWGDGEQSDKLYLEARVAMLQAFRHFKADLFMSSLTESTISMPMGTPDKRTKERHSTRHIAYIMLTKAEDAFKSTLEVVARTGGVEKVRQACVSVALLGAFQTSLGHGTRATAAAAAGILASNTSITLHRELLEAIDRKYTEADSNLWPCLKTGALSPIDIHNGDGVDETMLAYWRQVRARHENRNLLQIEYDLSILPTHWAVVSVTVTEDRNTMLVSRHQRGHEPIVFCIPLDRQGRRECENESELFTFDAGISELEAILKANVDSIQATKVVESKQEKIMWWNHRRRIDARLGDLLASIEFCWLGAFKTILNPHESIEPGPLAAFRERLDRIFQSALSRAGSGRCGRIRLNDALLACFATLSSKCKDEEVEDLVYFILDLYQFHGIAVALAELDFDQIGVDVKTALADLENATRTKLGKRNEEHLFLVLDKNVQGIPWESIPILRGRAVSRVPSLPILLDQIALPGRHKTIDAEGSSITSHRLIDPTKTHFFLNPSGDLVRTQGRFEGRLTALKAKGWQGTMAQIPSEETMIHALKDHELVVYFGHGGGEAYISATKIRSLPRCAVTMLWGCSSGLLRDYGDLDPNGTPWDYVLAGSPCLVANLWDVTDKDLDLVTEAVMDRLGLEASQICNNTDNHPGKDVSIIQAVNSARTSATLPYLTGAALVVYGIPVYVA